MNGDIGKDVARRYPLSLALKYVAACPAAVRNGVGETVWMGSRELAFLAKGSACVGDKMALYIEWPVLLQDEVPLQLIVTAQIVQRSGLLNIARMTRHEFRTRGAQSSAISGRTGLAITMWDGLSARQLPGLRMAANAPQWQPAVALAAGG